MAQLNLGLETTVYKIGRAWKYLLRNLAGQIAIGRQEASEEMTKKAGVVLRLDIIYQSLESFYVVEFSDVREIETCKCCFEMNGDFLVFESSFV
ncbi:hypothetical protein PRIC2_008576 [Phytophthora ramorum]